MIKNTNISTNGILAILCLVLAIVLAIVLILFLLILEIKQTLKNPEFWYKNFICRSSQDKKILKFISKILNKDGYFYDEKNKCYIYQTFFSNNEIQPNNNTKSNTKTNANRKVLIKFFGCLPSSVT